MILRKIFWFLCHRMLIIIDYMAERVIELLTEVESSEWDGREIRAYIELSSN